jgi:hypothetical protein
MTLQDRELDQALERAVSAHGHRVITVRVPATIAELMKVRAKESRRPLRVEYNRALDAWLGGPPGPA